ARAVKTYIAPEESRDGKRPGSNYGFVVEAFCAEKSLAVGDINRRIVEVRLGNGGPDFLGVSIGARNRHNERSERDRPEPPLMFSQVVLYEYLRHSAQVVDS